MGSVQRGCSKCWTAGYDRPLVYGVCFLNVSGGWLVNGYVHALLMEGADGGEWLGARLGRMTVEGF
jgi:hypothetical protein